MTNQSETRYINLGQDMFEVARTNFYGTRLTVFHANINSPEIISYFINIVLRLQELWRVIEFCSEDLEENLFYEFDRILSHVEEFSSIFDYVNLEDDILQQITAKKNKIISISRIYADNRHIFLRTTGPITNSQLCPSQ